MTNESLMILIIALLATPILVIIGVVIHMLWEAYQKYKWRNLTWTCTYGYEVSDCEDPTATRLVHTRVPDPNTEYGGDEP